MLPETWTLLRRTNDFCMVQRAVDGRTTLWTLQDRGAGWRVYAIRFSKLNAGTNKTPERTKVYTGKCKAGLGLCNGGSTHKNGIRLTDSRIDRILLDYCEGRRN
jgi:hypothetical protein